MPKYTYTPVTDFIVKTYNEISGRDIYADLGSVDFTKATLVVEASSEQEAEAICKGITDIRMWSAGPVQD